MPRDRRGGQGGAPGGFGNIPIPSGTPTIEMLYEAYMDLGEFAPGGEYAPEGGETARSFAQDIWAFFGTGGGAEQFEKEYGMYLPYYDVADEHLAFQDKALSFIKAADTYTLSKEATDRVYSEEMKKVSGALEEEMAQGRQAAGQLGLRSGSLESALEGAVTSSSNKVANLGDRFDIQKEDTLNAYNQAMVDSTLDYDRDIVETKQAFYDRVMASLMKLVELGAFDWQEEYEPRAPYTPPTNVGR